MHFFTKQWPQLLSEWLPINFLFTDRSADWLRSFKWDYDAQTWFTAHCVEPQPSNLKIVAIKCNVALRPGESTHCDSTVQLIYWLPLLTSCLPCDMLSISVRIRSQTGPVWSRSLEPTLVAVTVTFLQHYTALLHLCSRLYAVFMK